MKDVYTIPFKSFQDVGINLIMEAMRKGDEVRIVYELGFVTISIHDTSVGEIRGMGTIMDEITKRATDDPQRNNHITKAKNP